VHQIRFRPGLRWGSLQCSPRPPSWFKGALLVRRRGRERKGEERQGGEGEGRWKEEGRRRDRLPLTKIAGSAPDNSGCTE